MISATERSSCAKQTALRLLMAKHAGFGGFGPKFNFGGGRSARYGGPGGGQLKIAPCANSGSRAGLIMLGISSGGFKIMFDFGSRMTSCEEVSDIFTR